MRQYAIKKSDGTFAIDEVGAIHLFADYDNAALFSGYEYSYHLCKVVPVEVREISE